MKIAYLHGLESKVNPADLKIKFLNSNFSQVYAPGINYRDPDTFLTLLTDISKMKPHLIVGSSIGGYIAYLIGESTGIPTLLFNPAVIGRSFEPQVHPTTQTQTHHTIALGSHDNVINGKDITQWFKTHSPSKWSTQTYLGGHRVPLQVFTKQITDVINNIYNI
jgi:predicted esterase YcpF (UPF0227 family)